VSFEQKVHADVQDRFWSYRCDIAMFMKNSALAVNDFKSPTVRGCRCEWRASRCRFHCRGNGH
jgi:hypothetical protein